MTIDGYKEYQSKLVEAIQPLLQFGSEQEREEFREIIGNTLYDRDGPRHSSSPFSRRDDIFLARFFLEFNEIVNSYLSLKDIEVYIRRFPYKDTGVSSLRYLKYHVGSYLNEVYIFKERFERHLTFIQRRYRKSPINKEVNETLENIQKIISVFLHTIVAIRGSHVHEREFKDKDLDRLEFLEMITGYKSEHDFDLAYELAVVPQYIVLKINWKNINTSSCGLTEKTSIHRTKSG